MISKQETADIVKEYGALFGKGEKDSGTAEVQVALLTTRINNLKPHFDQHIHDFHSNRGLLKLIGKRRRLLRYVQKSNRDNYAKLIQKLGLRK